MSCLEACGVGTLGGAVVGGLTGFALSIWVAVDFVQPAFDSIDGISSPGASGITAAIALLGGVEAFIALGACAGAMLGAIITPLVACCAGNNNSSFFVGRNANKPRALPAEATEAAPMAITV